MSETLVQKVEGEVKKVATEIEQVAGEAAGEVKKLFTKAEDVVLAEVPVILTEFEAGYNDLKTKAAAISVLDKASAEYKTLKAVIIADATALRTKLVSIVSAL